MNIHTITRASQPEERLLILPLDVTKAADLLQRALSPSELAELVRRLHWALREEEGQG
jgi:hypothetical protein